MHWTARLCPCSMLNASGPPPVERVSICIRANKNIIRSWISKQNYGFCWNATKSSLMRNICGIDQRLTNYGVLTRRLDFLPTSQGHASLALGLLIPSFQDEEVGTTVSLKKNPILDWNHWIGAGMKFWIYVFSRS